MWATISIHGLLRPRLSPLTKYSFLKVHFHHIIESQYLARWKKETWVWNFTLLKRMEVKYC
ncbi:hypothetical protein CIPAW_09G193300 [Carya illinoinensis]|uniref:Uncharacterized protein n=1 Tax=Carya illinoinensis TaxID=32201 RepID=A0A8T1PG16_CARIL|nr:hypothetical protein CIPAW_09G193300 [Carya illinoinensis]